MKKVIKYVKHKPHLALSISTILCALTFSANLIAALRDGVIDDTELHALLTTAQGFEAFVLFIVMIALKDKKK